MRKLLWTEPSLEDLDAIFDFISKDSEYYASSFVNEIITHAEKLLIFPEMGRMVPEYGQKYVREIIFQTYRIIYQLAQDRILVLTVVHGRRDLLGLSDEFID